MKTIIFGIGLMVAAATATPVFAQAYCACWGTGNVNDEPRLEKTNGAYGYEMSVRSPAYARLNGKSAYAYSPAVHPHLRHK